MLVFYHLFEKSQKWHTTETRFPLYDDFFIIFPVTFVRFSKMFA